MLCDNAPEISEICELADKLALLGRKQSRNPSIIEICNAILDLDRQIRAEVLPRI